MFEAIVTLCLLGNVGLCREVLLPGFEAEDRQVCADALLTRDLSSFEDYQTGPPRCEPSGAASDVQQIASGVYAHRGRISEAGADNLGDVSNMGFVIGPQSVAVIDTGGSRQVGERLYRAIRARTDLPISHVILTHMHPDHVLGASVFADTGAEIVGHAHLARALQDRRASYMANYRRLIGEANFIGTRMVLPDIEISERAEIDLGGRRLRLRAWPTAHTATDLTVEDTQSGVLFTGDLVFDRHTPALDGSLLGWQRVLGELRGLDASRAVPGHGGPVLDWPAGATATLHYLDVLASETRAALAKGVGLAEAAPSVAQSQAPNWQLFDLFNPRNATVAYTELEWE